jgi:putative transposase
MNTMASQPHSTTEPSPTVHRTVRVRLYPGDAELGNRLAGTAGACRFVFNRLLGDQNRLYALWRSLHVPALHWSEVRGRTTEWGRAQRQAMGSGPSTSYFTFSQRFKEMWDDPELAWLHEYSYKVLRNAGRDLALAFNHYFKSQAAFADRGEQMPVRKSDGKPITHPRFKSRHRGESSFGLPDGVSIRDGRLRVPKVGLLRMGPLRLYADCKPLTVRVRRETHGAHPKWYAYICYEVPADHADVDQPAPDGALGLDRNVGQATDSNGVRHDMPGRDRMDAQVKRLQRELSRKQGWGPQSRGKRKSNRGRRINGRLQKLHRKRARKRDDATHQTSRKLADTAHTVVVEDLNTKGMTASAQGTEEQPGRNVKQKTGLNREILASGWGGLERKLAYKAGALVKVDPAYTSQACSRCGFTYKSNRPSQSVFRCGTCRFRLNADHNAAINILTRAGLPHVSANGPRARGCCAARSVLPRGPNDPRTRSPVDAVNSAI